nr:MAG TPA: hypothetical protein [Caudoviricetes sp.]
MSRGLREESLKKLKKVSFCRIFTSWSHLRCSRGGRAGD